MKRAAVFFALMLFLPSGAFADKNFGTGDADWEAVLHGINSASQSDQEGFKHHMAQRYGVGDQTVDRLMLQAGFSAADVSIALKLSVVTRRPVDAIVRMYEADQGRGWGAVAKSLGIKPGSSEFHELKNDSKSFLEETKIKGNAKNKNKDKGKGKDKNTSSGKGKVKNK